MVESLALAASLNGDCHAAELDRAALDAALREQGEDFFRLIAEGRPHLFANAAMFISAAQLEQMQAVVDSVEQVAALPGWPEAALRHALPIANFTPRARGVFMGYDFHLNADGAHLIEINTNAGGAYLNALLLQSQQSALQYKAAAAGNLEQVFLDMFRDEWRLERGDMPLRCIVIVDKQPQQQYLYPEFLLAQRQFERAGIRSFISDPAALELRADGLYCEGYKVDLVYNRLTDFALGQHAMLAAAYQANQVVLTPHPRAYALYADKRNLTLLTDVEGLRAMGGQEKTVAALNAGVPQTRVVQAADHDQWWAERKHWFFKPVSGYGGKGTYRGAGITRRVFEEIMQDGYVAQKLAAPGERMVCLGDAKPSPLKSDVRCFVYGGVVQLVAARLYQGQTTNFRTPGGGFAPVCVIG